MKFKDKNWELHDLYIRAYMIYLECNLEKINDAKKSGINKEHKDKIRDPFFIIYCSFSKVLPLISDGALKLYLYCGFRSDYKKGYFEFDYDTVKEDLHVTKRCIYNWVNELKKINLLFEINDDCKKYMFICPYDSDIKYDNHDDTDAIIKKYNDWINLKKLKIRDKKIPFCFINTRFENYWDNLKLSSIKVYIYCHLFMNKKMGFFYRSIETISNDLNISPRTVSTAFKELQNNRLVERHQLEFNKVAYTYVIPLIEQKATIIKYKYNKN